MYVPLTACEAAEVACAQAMNCKIIKDEQLSYQQGKGLDANATHVIFLTHTQFLSNWTKCATGFRLMKSKYLAQCDVTLATQR